MSHDAKLAGDILELNAAARESTANAMTAANEAKKLIQGGSAFEQLTGCTPAGRAGTRRRMVDQDQLKAVALAKIVKNHCSESDLEEANHCDLKFNSILSALTNFAHDEKY